MAKRLRNTTRTQYQCEGNCDGELRYPCMVCTKYVDGVAVGMEGFPANPNAPVIGSGGGYYPGI